MKKILGLDFSNFRGDLFGGITAGIVALPLALAFGVQSGLGAVAGLYGAIFISFFAALLGGTNTQISGPTAPMTAVSMVIVGSIIALNDGDMGRAVPAILGVFMLAGIFQVLFGVIKIGRYIRYIPYPVVSGFMTGIGVIIIITQVLPLIGYYPKEDTRYVEDFIPQAEEVLLEKILIEEANEEILVLEDFEETAKRAKLISEEEIMREAKVLAAKESSGVIGTFRVITQAAKHINYVDLILALLTIAIIYGFKRITKVVPSTLVALVLVSLGAFFLTPGYRTIGEIPGGFPGLQLDIFTKFNLSSFMPFIVSALSLAVLGSIDSLLTSVVADNMTKTKHNPDKELVGQGIGNSIAAIFGGIPGAGATIRTVVNINSGGKTKLSGMMAGILLLVVLLSLGPIASKIPAAVLAGILMTVGIGVMDYKGLKQIKQLPISEVVVMILVLGLTVFIGLIEAVAVGLILSSVLFMKKISDMVEHRTVLSPIRKFSHEIPWADEGEIIDKLGDKVYIKHLDGPLFFGFASRFQEMIVALPKVRVVVMRMDKVPYVDQSGLYAMEDSVLDLQSRGIEVVFTDLHGQPLEMFKQFNLVPNVISEEYCFKDFTSCAEWLVGHCEYKGPQDKKIDVQKLIT